MSPGHVFIELDAKVSYFIGQWYNLPIKNDISLWQNCARFTKNDCLGFDGIGMQIIRFCPLCYRVEIVIDAAHKPIDFCNGARDIYLEIVRIQLIVTLQSSW